MKKLWILLLVLVLWIPVGCSGKKGDNTGDRKGEAKTQAPAEAAYVTIGTGAITGVYYPAGGAIATMINTKRDTYNIRCTVEATGGSVFNVNAIMAGDLDFGVVQSDRQYQAVNGKAEWSQKGAQKNLRAVFSLHSESVTLIAAVDAGIQTMQDLKGKRINVGNPGSGQLDALQASGINYETDLDVEKVKLEEASGLLQDGRIDAFFYTVEHPNGAIKEAVSGARKVRFIPITGIDKLLQQYGYYAKSTVPVSAYPGVQNENDVPTFGVKATMVSSANVPDRIVYALTKVVFENLETFKTLHPAFAALTPQNMLEGLCAPIHSGAMKYYKEVGLSKD